MRALRTCVFLVLAAAAMGCEGMLQEKELDQGKVDRAMEQVEKGTE